MKNINLFSLILISLLIPSHKVLSQELLSNNSESIVNINRVVNDCGLIDENNELCESYLDLSITNNTTIDQKYIVIEANIYDEKGQELTDNACFDNREIIDLGLLKPNRTIQINGYYRKYFKYGSAKIINATFSGINEPELLVNSEIEYECP